MWNFKPVVVLWRALDRFYSAWDPRSSLIQAFASLFGLMMVVLIMIPHCVLWGYVVWKVMLYVVKDASN